MHAGKAVSIAKAVDVAETVDTIRYYAGWADKMQVHPHIDLCCVVTVDELVMCCCCGCERQVMLMQWRLHCCGDFILCRASIFRSLAVTCATRDTFVCQFIHAILLLHMPSNAFLNIFADSAYL